MRGRGAWLLAAGLALGLMPMSHYSSAPTAAALWAAMSILLLLERGPPHPTLSPLGRGKGEGRWRCVGLLTAGPLLAAAALLATNFVRYGLFFTTGYHLAFGTQAEQFMRVEYVPRNLRVLGGWLLRTPWLAPALAIIGILCSGTAFQAVKDHGQDARATAEHGRMIFVPVLLAIVAQTFFWLCYRDLYLMTNRYLLPMTGLWALGLPLLAQRLEARFPARGLGCTLLLFLVTGFAGFMRDDGIRAFYTDPAGAMRCCAWYMQPPPHPTQFGTPCGPVQWLVLLALLAGGTALLVRAWKLAGQENASTGVSAPPFSAET